MFSTWFILVGVVSLLKFGTIQCNCRSVGSMTWLCDGYHIRLCNAIKEGIVDNKFAAFPAGGKKVHPVWNF